MLKYLKTNYWKDTYNINANLKQNISKNFSLKYVLNSLNFDDHQTGLQNDYSKFLIGIKPAYNNELFFLNGGLSGIIDERMSKKDKGWNIQLSFENTEFDINDYYIDFSSNLSKDKLGKRDNYNYVNKVSFHREFTGNSADTLSFSWNENRADYYISADHEIESRRNNSKSINNNLSYNLSENTFLSIKSYLSVGQTQIKYPYNDLKGEKLRDDFSFNNVIEIRNYSGENRYNFLIGWDNSEQNYKLRGTGKISGLIPFDTPSSKSKKIFITTGISNKLSKRDSLGVNFYVEKYSFDTPSELNNDDRDEFRLNFLISNFYRFNPDLSIGCYLNVNLNHLVFLYKERSIENNWNRIFILGSGVRYKNKNLRISNFSEIIANYTDYDYEEMFTVYRSFVFRKYSNFTNIGYIISRKSEVDFRVNIEKEENGMLNWSDFSQNVTFSKINWHLKTVYRYKFSKELALLNGIEYLSRKYISGIDLTTGTLESKNLEDLGVTIGFEFKGKKLNSVFNVSNRRIKRKSNKTLFQAAEIKLYYSI